LIIKNRADLERAHGKGAKIVLGAVEAAIKSVEPGMLVKRAVKAGKDSITFSDIYKKSFTIRDFKDVYVVGAGKAAGPMAAALSKMLKGRVTGGAINVPKRTRHAAAIDRISITYASHPVPDESGVRGAKRITGVLEKANEDDLAIVLISGGGSALLPLPAEGISLLDKQRVTKDLLASGASIFEINTVRKHLSAVKGGQLARRARCRVVSLVLSDVVGDDLAVIASGPTFPDPTTYSDALEIIKRHKIRNARVARHLERGAAGKIADTPKPGDSLFSRVKNVLVGNNQVACESAARYLALRQIPAVESLGSEFDGEAQDFGRFVARVASGRSGPFALVAGGETTVRLGNTAANNGKGGRNQEAALACALSLNDPKGITAAFVGTDGIDGNSDAAGAIVSDRSAAGIAAVGPANVQNHLRSHDSYHALKKMKSLVFTGYTGTNVNDIAIALRLNTS
jgi:glycerate 2-kinase